MDFWDHRVVFCQKCWSLPRLPSAKVQSRLKAFHSSPRCMIRPSSPLAGIISEDMSKSFPEICELLLGAAQFDDDIRIVARDKDDDLFLTQVAAFRDRIQNLKIGQVCVWYFWCKGGLV